MAGGGQRQEWKRKGGGLLSGLGNSDSPAKLHTTPTRTIRRQNKSIHLAAKAENENYGAANLTLAGVNWVCWGAARCWRWPEVGMDDAPMMAWTAVPFGLPLQRQLLALETEIFTDQGVS